MDLNKIGSQFDQPPTRPAKEGYLATKVRVPDAQTLEIQLASAIRVANMDGDARVKVINYLVEKLSGSECTGYEVIQSWYRAVDKAGVGGTTGSHLSGAIIFCFYKDRMFGYEACMELGRGLLMTAAEENA